MSRFASAIRLPSAKFPEVGASYEGTVVEIGESEVPHFDEKTGRPSGKPKTNENGEVVTQVDVTIEDAEGVKTVIHTDGAIFYAIGRALANIGADDLNVGDRLRVTYTGDGEPTAKGRNAPKQYEATVVAASTTKARKG